MRHFFRILLILCLAGWATAAPKNANVTVLSGWVRAASEDAQGKVLEVELVVGEPPKEEPYLIARGPVANELIEKAVGKWVVVSGSVSEDALGWKTVQIKTYKLEDELETDKVRE